MSTGLENHEVEHDSQWAHWNTLRIPVGEETPFTALTSNFPETPKTSTKLYPEHGTIDWNYEEAADRARKLSLQSHRGFRGLLYPLLDSSKLWVIMVVTGIGIGIIGAWMDVLVAWLNDLRSGHCNYGFFYNNSACCSGLDPGEICVEWQSWADWLGFRSILMSSLLHSLIYVLLAIAFATSSSILVQYYAPYAFHTGIPEIKAILGGYVFDEFLSPWTLLIKGVGLPLAVASGLSLGKEGPLVHVACCMAHLISRLFTVSWRNESQKRKMLAAAAAAGVSVAFGSPLGGVLFGLEELDTFPEESETLWRAFVTSALAAVSLQYVDPFGTAKLVLFEVNSISDTWRAFELVPWIVLSVLGGVLGAYLIRLNAQIAVYRRHSLLHEHPLYEVAAVAAVTAVLSYMVIFLRVSSSDLISFLFQDCDSSKSDYHGLCNPNAGWENIFLLIVSASIKIALTAWTFGMKIPAGIFLPTIAIGASLGRAMGILVQKFHHTFPTSIVFSNCPPDPLVPCISPGFYSVIGASAMLGGVTRMTISLVVILFELTGALSHVLPIMLSVMTSKWVADAFGKEGIYPSWIAMRHYPWLGNHGFRDHGETADRLTVKPENIVTIRNGCSVSELKNVVEISFHGYPVLDGSKLLGFVTREHIRRELESLPDNLQESGNPVNVTFLGDKREGNPLDFSGLLDSTAVYLKPETPLEILVSMFQKLNLRYVLLSQNGELKGIITKRDVSYRMTEHVPFAGELNKSTSALAGGETSVLWSVDELASAER